MVVLAMSAALLFMQAPGAARSSDEVIAGQLHKPDGTAAAGVRIGVVSAEETSGAVESFISIAETDRDGRYRLEQVTPGRYFLMAGPLDAPAYFPGVGSRQEATVITVANGKPLGAFDFKVGLVVAGRIFDEGGAELGGDPSILSLEDGRGTKSRARQSADHGFEFRYAWPGRYWLTVGSTRLTAITITDKDIAGLRVVVPRFNVRGRVVLPPGLPKGTGSSSVRLRRTGPGPSPAPAGLVGSDGAFEFLDVLPGQYLIDVGFEGSGRTDGPFVVDENLDNLMQRRIPLEGVVKQLEVRNPRTLVVLTVTDDKGARDVDFVGPPGVPATRSGFAKVKAGDRLKVVLNPRVDGGEGGRIVAFVDADGKEVDVWSYTAR